MAARSILFGVVLVLGLGAAISVGWSEGWTVTVTKDDLSRREVLRALDGARNEASLAYQAKYFGTPRSGEKFSVELTVREQ